MGLKQFSHSILSCRVSSSLYPKDLMSSDFVTGPKSVCLMFQRLKVKTSEFGVSFIDVESAIREEGRPNPQIHLTGVQSSDFFYVRRRGNERRYFATSRQISSLIQSELHNLETSFA